MIHKKTKISNDLSVPIKYGDAEDIDFTKNLPLNKIKWIVSSIPHYSANEILISSLRENKYAGKIAVCAYHDYDLELIRKLNVDMIFTPYKDATLVAADKLADILLHEHT